MPGVCPRCLKNVYFAEEVRCLGKTWHKLCLVCQNCKRLLEPGMMLEHKEEMFCKSCHRSQFGPKGYGFGGILANEETQSPEKVIEEPGGRTRSGGGWVSPRAIRETKKSLVDAGLDSLDTQKVPRKTSEYWPGGFSPDRGRTALRKVTPGFGSGAASGSLTKNSVFKQFEKMSLNHCENQNPRIKISEPSSDYKLKKVDEVDVQSNSNFKVKKVDEVEVQSNSDYKVKKVVELQSKPDFKVKKVDEVEVQSKSDFKVKKVNEVKVSHSSPPKSSTLPRYSICSKPATLFTNPNQLALKSAFNTPNRCQQSSGNSNHLLNKEVPRTNLSDIPKQGYQPKPSPWRPSTAPSCSRCSKAVYLAEQVRGAGGVWHKTCFTCTECGKLLDSTTLCDREGQIYCKKCYSRNFGPKGVGYGLGGNLQT